VDMTLEPNLMLNLGLIESNYMRPLAEWHVEVNRKGLEDLVNWAKLVKNIFVWDYVVDFDHYNMPYPNLDVLVPNVKFYVDHNVRYLMAQGAHTTVNGEFAQLRAWVLAKAMWNPEANNQELITDFFTHYYEAAAPAIQEYINITHKPSRETVFESSLTDDLNMPYLAPDLIAAAEVAMQKAEKLVQGNPVLEKRVRHAHLPVWYIIAHRSPGGATWRAVEKATGRPVDLVQIANQIQTITTDKPENIHMQYADHEPFKPWVEWVRDYAAQVAANGGKQPIPTELKGVDPGEYKIIQACQMDGRSRFWHPCEGASDGWSCTVSTPAYTIRHYPMAMEDYQPGKKYGFYVRIKPGKILASSGKAFAIGANDIKYSPPEDLDISKLKPDQWQVVKIGEIELTNKSWLFFATNASVMSEYELDCYWFKELTVANN